VAYVNWNLHADKKFKLKSEQELKTFGWEKQKREKGEAKRVMKQIVANRELIKNKWKLRYHGEE
jgi:hypothetical protein